MLCRYCGEPFALMPNKPGYANECPDCQRERAEAAKPKPKRAWEAFMEYLAEHPVTIRTTDGRLFLSRTRVDLVARLHRLRDEYGNRLSEAAITKIADAYIAAVEQSEVARHKAENSFSGR